MFVNGMTLRINSIVYEEPIEYDKDQSIKVQGFTVYLPREKEIKFGDGIIVEGVVDGKVLREARLLSVRSESGVVYIVREKIIEFVRRTLPEPHSGLVAGMTLGSKSLLPNRFWNDLKNTGLAHVVVASGMNISLVANFVMQIMLIFYSRKKAVFFSLFFIWLYAFISGFDAPIIRASIMGCIALFAQLLGKVYLPFWALNITALIMLTARPLWVMDLGFLLSYFSTASILLFSRRIKKCISRVPGVLKDNLSTSLSAQIGVAPLLLIYFGNYNFLSVLINLLVFWTIAPITVLGMLACMASLISNNLGSLILYLSYPFTAWFVFVVNIFRQI